MKKRNKVSAEFNMSSLTDIIFNITVVLPKNGKMKLNNKPIRMSRLHNEVSKLLRAQENRKGATLTIVAEKTTPWKSVQDAMEVASKLKMNAILATQPKK